MQDTYRSLNAELNIIGENGEIQFDKDKAAAKAYFLEHVNPNTVFFHSLKEKKDYLTENGYWDSGVLDKYDFDDVKTLFRHAYSFKFRFRTFLGAFKFYTQYALKTFDGSRYLERYEDRVTMVALALADGNPDMAQDFITEMITGRFQPATPTFLNLGKAQRGEPVSCFLLRVEDNMESIGRVINSSLQLSKRGGGVGILLTNLRESGAPIKRVEGQSSGVVPVMKILEDSFSYANQLGARQGAGAVYLHAHHPDIMTFLDTKRENADEKIRIKTLSLGVIIPDITFELARNNADMYLFSPYDVERVEGKPMSELSVTEHYDKWVEDGRIRKKKVNARKFFTTIAEIQFESGYPYILYEDNANRPDINPVGDRINMSNLCSEILQGNEPSVLNEDLTYSHVGRDISCNLGSLNIAKAMASPNLGETIETAIIALTKVAEGTNIESVPSIRRGNSETRAVGLGQMNLHGYLGEKGIEYGSPEALEFVDAYFRTVLYHSLKASVNMARTTGNPYKGWEESGWAKGTAFEKYLTPYGLTHDRVKDMFADHFIPDMADWEYLKDDLQKYGIYNKYLLAVPPTGSISYINDSTSSIHPIASQIEIRKEGKTGRTYYPAPGMTNENRHLFADAYEIGPEKIIDTYAAAQAHTDQGMSLTLFFPDTATTRDLNRAQIYAWRKGIKSLYYIRIRQVALEGTGIEGCVSCML